MVYTDIVDCLICKKRYASYKYYAKHIIRAGDDKHQEYRQGAWAFLSQEGKLVKKYLKGVSNG